MSGGLNGNDMIKVCCGMCFGAGCRLSYRPRGRKVSEFEGTTVSEKREVSTAKERLLGDDEEWSKTSFRGG